ncbi:hypothetical protein FRB93_001301 [Tulasnella sp. JGI-2019a]|nr:hypothetical protein FRB93_001301 [Tulasnella sp. JGI-2019a]
MDTPAAPASNVSPRSLVASDQLLPPTSISLLPIELFIRVVYWLLPRKHESYWHSLDSHTEYFSTLYRYMRVSKHWEKVIRNTEEFWGIVDCRLPDAVWRGALARSEVQPLTVLLSSHGTDLKKHDLDHRDCFVQTFRHIHRWGAAQVFLQRSEDISLFNSSEASKLQKLYIYLTNYTNRPHLQISQFTIPSLRHLSLSWITLDSLCVSRLESFTLRYAQLSSVDHLLSALGNNPGLHSLSLTDCNFDDETTNTSGIPPVRLERLTKLSLVRLDSKASTILDTLYSPNCSTYHLTHSQVHPGAVELAESFIGGKERAVLLQSLLSKHRRFNICMDEEKWEVDTQADGDDVVGSLADHWALCVRDVSPRQILLGWIAPIIRSCSFTICVTLKVRDAFSDLSEHEIFKLLRSLNGLESLELDCHDNQIDLVIEKLSHPTILDDGAHVWLCPKLHTIQIKDCQYSSAATLLGLVKRRAEASGLSDVWPMRCLGVWGDSPMDHMTWLQITFILGGVAFWYPDRRARRILDLDLEVDDDDDG